jgi:hypothetical protein
MTPAPALIIIPAYDYILVWIRVPWTHRSRKVTVTKSRIAFPRKVL